MAPAVAGGGVLVVAWAVAGPAAAITLAVDGAPVATIAQGDAAILHCHWLSSAVIP
jgi:hypothetical protein